MKVLDVVFKVVAVLLSDAAKTEPKDADDASALPPSFDMHPTSVMSGQIDPSNPTARFHTDTYIPMN